MVDIGKIIGRNTSLFNNDILKHCSELDEMIQGSRFLVIGAAGTIGSAVTKEIFKRNPKTLHAVDLSENGLAELVRDVRSSLKFMQGEFKTFSLDICSSIFDIFLSNYNYDYILNLCALKHVRSEKDPFTLMRMIETNVIATRKVMKLIDKRCCKKYFAVSTDKATNPVNMMGASKLLMEQVLMGATPYATSSARFANVAFSNGSLLASFSNRFQLKQPFAGPSDIERYFVSPEESGQLCLLSCLLGENNDIFFPKPNEQFKLESFQEIAERFLYQKGYRLVLCDSEDEAKSKAESLIPIGSWPGYFSASNTTGEKTEEEFYTEFDTLDLTRFETLGVVKGKSRSECNMEQFIEDYYDLLKGANWKKPDLVNLFRKYLQDFSHQELFSSLDDKM